jgi:SAM-dependent methyltransferase
VTSGPVWNDPAAVRVQYEDERNLQARQAIYAGAEGPDARQVAFDAVAEVSPRTVLEVGGGQGELAERFVRELGVELQFLDQSERMVELARARGLDASVGDAQDLPFADGQFDCAVAAWMLYHVPDVDRAVAELARVLRPGGRLVAVTNADDHLRELSDLAGFDAPPELTFRSENGAEILGRSFAEVDRRDAFGSVTIPTDELILAYLRSMSSATAPESLPAHELPLRVRRCPTIFVATK